MKLTIRNAAKYLQGNENGVKLQFFVKVIVRLLFEFGIYFHERVFKLFEKIRKCKYIPD